MEAEEKIEKKWYLYMLLCGDDTLYTGITDDVEKRLSKHREGKGAKYTRGRGPLKLVYQCACENHSQALQLEYKMKKLTRQQKLELVERWKQNDV